MFRLVPVVVAERYVHLVPQCRRCKAWFLLGGRVDEEESAFLVALLVAQAADHQFAIGQAVGRVRCTDSQSVQFLRLYRLDDACLVLRRVGPLLDADNVDSITVKAWQNESITTLAGIIVAAATGVPSLDAKERPASCQIEVLPVKWVPSHLPSGVLRHRDVSSLCERRQCRIWAIRGQHLP